MSDATISLSILAAVVVLFVWRALRRRERGRLLFVVALA